MVKGVKMNFNHNKMINDCGLLRNKHPLCEFVIKDKYVVLMYFDNGAQEWEYHKTTVSLLIVNLPPFLLFIRHVKVKLMTVAYYRK